MDVINNEDSQSTRHQNHQYTFVDEINIDEIIEKEFLGEGSFGKVFRGEWRGLDVAVKQIIESQMKPTFDTELRQLSRVNHENIIKLYGACTRAPNYCLVMEYAEGGSLFYILHLAKNIEYYLSHALSWSFQCAKGIEYLHGMRPKSLIHRDIKSPNLLLVDGGARLKICDFGTAADKSTQMTNNRGSAAWMAPEVFATTRYTEKCDVYSYGVIFWEILARQRPFYKPSAISYQIMWRVYKGDRPPLLEDCPKVIEDLICRCWNQDPNVRPDMSYIVQLMTKIVSIFPNTNEPVLRHDSTTTMSEDERLHRDEEDDDYVDGDGDGEDDDEEETFEDLYEETYATSLMANSMASSARVPPTTLRQPTAEMMRPLSIPLEDNWEILKGDELFLTTEMELQETPGFDKMIHHHNTSNDDAKTNSVLQVGSSQRIKGQSDRRRDSDRDLDNMYMLLDEDLRPATPDMSHPTSVAIFEDHKKLAQEYFEVQTELVYATQHCQKLKSTTQSPEKQKRRQNIRQLEEERDSLRLCRDALIEEQRKLDAVSKRNRNSRLNRRLD